MIKLQARHLALSLAHTRRVVTANVAEGANLQEKRFQLN
jgi:hypothetical protein